MKFSTSIPGVFRYPPVSAAWESAMGPADFRLVARTIDELGFDSISVPEHIVMPTEMVDVMGAEWPYVAFDRIAFEPKPVQQPHPPVWIGGNSRAAMRRALPHDGWYPWLITAADLPASLDYLRAQPEYEQRSRPLDICMPVSPPAVDEQHRPLRDQSDRPAPPHEAQALIDTIGELADLGVTWTSVPVPPARSLDERPASGHARRRDSSIRGSSFSRDLF